MRCSDTSILATGVCLPDATPVDAAVAEGLCDRDHAALTRQEAVTVASADQQAPDIAVAAARQAIERAEQLPTEIGAIFHAVVLHAGLDAWNCGSYLQRQLGIDHPGCFVLEVRSGCAAGVTGLEVAQAHLATHTGPATALVTAAECYSSIINRWKIPGAVMADGGSAILISRQRPGFARLLSICTVTDPSLEQIERGQDPFRPFHHGPDNLVDMQARLRAFLRTMSAKEMTKRRQTGLCAAVLQATREADVKLADIAHVVYPFMGYTALETGCLKPLGVSLEQTVWEYGRRIGHMGAADAFAGLDHLVVSGRMSPPDLALLIGSGAGCIWTVAVVQMVRCPKWAG
jgi:3-oxoacyl-[acyl-carrier-protein] synthase-3